MKAPTTATIRAKHLETLAKRSEDYTKNPAETISRAARAMNSFYRLAGFSERLFYINNDYNLYQRYFKNGNLDRMEERESAWIKRVNGYLQEFHARAIFNGIYPSICEEAKPNDRGTIRDLCLTSWY